MFGVKPEDIVLMNIPGRPAVAPDGSVLVALSHPDLAGDRYRGRLRLLTSSAVPPVGVRGADFSVGPRDSAPVLSPDGRTAIFLRAGEKGPAQLYSIELDGGEARRLTAHPLGAGPGVFSADGARIAYLTPVPEDGRYGTDPDVEAEAEPARTLDRMS